MRTLIIFHYHYRPGGVRRIIEWATPYLIRRLHPRIGHLILAGGEAPPHGWANDFKKSLAGVSIEFFIEPAWRYLSECNSTLPILSSRMREAMRAMLKRCDPQRDILWAHNIGLGRNPLMAQALIEESGACGMTLILHHHDWWFDNRWQRWPEFRKCGFRSLSAAMQVTLPASPHVHHIGINGRDFLRLRRQFGKRAAWLPNLMVRNPPPLESAMRKTRSWLDDLLGEKAPVWLLPCRFLRRKNVAEALLLTRWLRPEAWLLVMGDISSAEEQSYAEALLAAAKTHGWKLHAGLSRKRGAPSASDFMLASEVVLLTSLQEGFGLTYLEAAATGRPLIARDLPNITPDLTQFGFRFFYHYKDIFVHPRLFDGQAERRRRQKRFRQWRGKLPVTCRKWVSDSFLRSKEKIAFSRLTLMAQLEVLTQPRELSWELCMPLNPFLKEWRSAAALGKLQKTHWPRRADRWLNGAAYAERFEEILLADSQGNYSSADPSGGFLGGSLTAQNLFPILWTSEP